MASGTLQPSSKDNYLEQGQPTTNHGSETTISLQDWSLYKQRMILEFDLSTIANSYVASATLQLYYYAYVTYNDPVGKTVWVYSMLHTDWVEAQSTWNIYKTGSNWTTAGGDYDDSVPPGRSAVFPAVAGWISWDVTQMLNEALAAKVNLELLVKFDDETIVFPGGNGSRALFYSKEYTGDTSKRPKLVLSDYTPATALLGNVFLSDIGYTTATATSELLSLGISSVTAHGFVWDINTEDAPTIVDSSSGYWGITDEGAGTLGLFDSAITGLTEGVKYIIRAYATNTEGTAYSNGVQFLAGSPQSVAEPGEITIVGEELRYISHTGKLRTILGS